MSMKARLAQFLSGFWKALRTLSGDDAYERYLEHLKHHHPDTAPMSRRSFCVSEQQRRWSGGPNRCC